MTKTTMVFVVITPGRRRRTIERGNYHRDLGKLNREDECRQPLVAVIGGFQT